MHRLFRLINLLDNRDLYLRFLIRIFVKISFVISPILLQKFIDAVTNKNKNLMLVFIGINILIYFVSQATFYFDDISKGICETKSYVNIVNKTHFNILNFDEKSYEINESSIFQNLGQNYELIKEFIFENPINILINAVYVFCIFLMMLRYSTLVSVVVVILIPIFIIFSKKYDKKFENINDSWIKSLEKSKKYLADTFKLRFLLRKDKNPFKSEELICEEYKINATKKYKFEAFFNNILSYASLNFMILFVQIISGYEVYRGNISIGSFFALSLYVSHFWSPIEFYVDVYKEYMSKKPIINKFFDFLNLKTLNENFEEINSFSLKNYAIDERSVKLNKDFKKGNIYLILGDNGSGKTTLFKNIFSVSKRYVGEIFINDSLKKDEYYKNIFFLDSEVNESEFFIGVDLTKKSMGQKKLFYLENLKNIDADLYLIDEPTNYITEDRKHLVTEILLELKEKGKIVLVATHDELLINDERFEKVNI